MTMTELTYLISGFALGVSIATIVLTTIVLTAVKRH